MCRSILNFLICYKDQFGVYFRHAQHFRWILQFPPLQQARSHVCVAGVARVHWRNHVVQNMKACNIIHVVIVKWIMCVQENIDLSGMSQRPRLSSSTISHNFRRFLLGYNDTAIRRQMQKFPGVARNWYPIAQGLHLPPHGWLKLDQDCV